MEHPPHLDYLTRERLVYARRDGLNIVSRGQVVLELRGGAERDSEKSSKTGVGFLLSSLDNVRWNGQRRPDDLTPKCRVLTATSTSGCTMGVERECVGLLPDEKLPVIAHARNCISGDEASPSFLRGRNPSSVIIVDTEVPVSLAGGRELLAGRP